MVVQVGKITVAITGSTATWKGGMSVDSDGSPRAYSLDGSQLRGLDFLANAGGPSPGSWYGVACDDDGVPFIQTRDDEAPGFLVSCTALQDKNYQERDPRRYVNAETVPYIVVPRSLIHAGVALGDLAIVQNGAIRCGAIVADIGGSKNIGEASIACAKALGINPDPRKGGCAGGVTYTAMLKSAATPPWPRVNVSQLALSLAAERGITV